MPSVKTATTSSWRFNSNGSVDTTFGTAGKTVTDFFGSLDKAYAVAIRPDDKIVVVGQARNGATNYQLAMARYTANGQIDTTFGTSGKTTLEMGHTDDAAWAIQILSNNQILVAGRGGISASTGYDFALARFNENGALDTNFGTSGQTLLDFGSGGDQAYALKVLSDGKILLGGRAKSSSKAMNFGLARFTSTGALDTTFGVGGKVSTDFRGSTDQGEAMAIQPDGNVIMAGGSSTVGSNGATDFALARYHLASTATKTIGVTTSGLSISGPAQIQSGLAYTLTLHDDSALAVQSWTINWGDGQTSGADEARRLSRTDFLRTEISLSAPPRSPTARRSPLRRWQWRSPRHRSRFPERIPSLTDRITLCN